MKLTTLVFSIMLASIALIGIGDAIEVTYFVKKERSPDIWYDQRWYMAPAYHAFLLFGDTTITKKPNYIKTELWTIKETKIQGKTFWTVLERKQI